MTVDRDRFALRFGVRNEADITAISVDVIEGEVVKDAVKAKVEPLKNADVDFSIEIEDTRHPVESAKSGLIRD